MKKTMLACLIVSMVILAGAALGSAGTSDEMVPQSNDAVQNLSIEEQNKQAYEIFKQILELSKPPEREKNLPKMKELYREIINRYPDIGLAQESYLRLVLLAKEEKTPAANAEAELLFDEFVQKYPESRLKLIIESELKKEQ